MATSTEDSAESVDLITGDEKFDKKEKNGDDAAASTKPRHPVFDVIAECGDSDDPFALLEFFEGSDAARRLDKADVEDASGMTPLMHAAWKGKPKMTKFLIDHVREHFS